METSFVGLRPLFVVIAIPGLIWGIIALAKGMGGPRYEDRHKEGSNRPSAVPWLVAIAAVIDAEGLFLSATQFGEHRFPIDNVIDVLAILAALSIWLLILTTPQKHN